MGQAEPEDRTMDSFTADEIAAARAERGWAVNADGDGTKRYADSTIFDVAELGLEDDGHSFRIERTDGLWTLVQNEGQGWTRSSRDVLTLYSMHDDPDLARADLLMQAAYGEWHEWRLISVAEMADIEAQEAAANAPR